MLVYSEDKLRSVKSYIRIQNEAVTRSISSYLKRYLTAARREVNYLKFYRRESSISYKCCGLNSGKFSILNYK